MPSHSGTLLAMISPRPLSRLPPYPSLPPREEGKGESGLTAPMALSPAFIDFQFRIIQNVITLMRAVFLIFREW